MAIDAYIMYHDYAQETVCCLVHSYLKDVLGHHQAEWHTQEPVSVTMGIKGGKI